MRRVNIALGLAACSVFVPTAAHAGPPDHTPPTLTRPVPHYALGTQINASEYDDGQGGYYIYDWSVRWTWTASDPSRICSQQLRYKDSQYEQDDPQVFSVKPGVRSYTGYVDGYDAGKGFPGYLGVTVKDCAGNTSTSDDADAPYINVSEDSDPGIIYRRAWGTGYFPGFSPGGDQGSVHYSTEKGASFTKSVKGGPVALVMERKSDRGAVAVYVDGKQVATVNTYTSGATVHRSVVWETYLAAGTHTFRVVNLATAGHPRVDLDAILN